MGHTIAKPDEKLTERKQYSIKGVERSKLEVFLFHKDLISVRETVQKYSICTSAPDCKQIPRRMVSIHTVLISL